MTICFFLASNLSKGFNNRAKRNNQNEHLLETDPKHLFFFESKQPKRWTDVIGDVDALSLLCQARPHVLMEGKLQYCLYFLYYLYTNIF